jgi:hypothetical protein
MDDITDFALIRLIKSQWKNLEIKLCITKKQLSIGTLASKSGRFSAILQIWSQIEGFQSTRFPC